jgi:predicted ATP-grasp superfamily ATP-dependent carboligase
MPCADDWLAATAALPVDLVRRFPSSIASRQVIDTVVDKWSFAQLLEKERVPHPRTLLLNSSADIEYLPDSGFGGAILKPLCSVAFSRTHGVKGFLIGRRDEARRLMRRLPFPIMLQEFIPGPPTFGYFIEGFMDRHGRMCALFARQRLRMYPQPLGNSTFMQSVALDEVAAAVATLQRLLESVSYRGVFSAEFKYDKRDGFFKLLEINARPYWYIEAPALEGMNLCQMSYLDALNMPVERVNTYQPGRRFGYPVADVRAWREQRRGGGQTLWSWLRSCRKAVPTPFVWNDPVPAVVLAYQQVSGYLRHKRAVRRERAAHSAERLALRSE